MPWKLKSEMMSNVMKILLWPLIVLAVVDVLFMAVYAIDLEVFAEYVFPFYGFENTVAVVLYYIVIILFLIWIYRVHMDLNLLFPRFPRTPGGSLACIMVPFYNFYGIPSVYNMIGTHFLTETTRLRKEGRWVRGLSVPLLIFMLGTNGLNRVIRGADEPSDTLLLSESISSLTLYAIFLILVLMVSQGLKKVYADSVEVMYAPEETIPEEAAVQQG
ncbi:hypothetical protein GE107_23170 [Cohnella sp. CFH 77786]|uniref:hypothetical protein n=1 Tax=Cohnella sp. CFH 77786 TaxID=2662265 RepID=UPI001C60F771|nr:hypothetical protein [Cohnella sp. CFH 77786]MBW5448945.1 hypothetical protein [Cohnella sp. CFH 77786]